MTASIQTFQFDTWMCSIAITLRPTHDGFSLMTVDYRSAVDYRSPSSTSKNATSALRSTKGPLSNTVHIGAAADLGKSLPAPPAPPLPPHRTAPHRAALTLLGCWSVHRISLVGSIHCRHSNIGRRLNATRDAVSSAMMPNSNIHIGVARTVGCNTENDRA